VTSRAAIRDGANRYALGGTAFGAFLLGLLGFSPQLKTLWTVWTADSLRSAGILVPPLALWLSIRAWRSQSFHEGGSWWGFPLIVFALAAARIGGSYPVGFAYLPGSMITALPIGLLLWIYASGFVLLFGGVQPWKSASFGLALLLLVNPVPGSVNTLFDLKLQYLSARVARSFAALLRLHISGEGLKMMFTPEFGMFIAPGCNGLRGAVALGLLALVVGHIRKVRPLPRSLLVVGSVGFAYLLNLLRLWSLLLFYWVALHFPGLQDHAEIADYVIGGFIFFLAAGFLFGVPMLMERT